MPVFARARASRSMLTSPCWLSSTPRPVSVSPLRTTFQGSVCHRAMSPSGTTSMWAKSQRAREELPGMVATKFGRLPPGTRSSGASTCTMSAMPASLSVFSMNSALAPSPRPPFSGPTARQAVSAAWISGTSSACAAISARSVSRSWSVIPLISSGGVSSLRRRP